MFLNPPDVGGRYSALTYVGLVPAALLGLDLAAAAGPTRQHGGRCRVADAANPGLWLGAAIGGAGEGGPRQADVRDRAAPRVAWRMGRAARSPRAPASTAPASCRLTASRSARPTCTATTASSCASAATATVAWAASTDAALDALAAAGHPVIDLAMDGGAGLGGEFFRWEFATAIAGAVPRRQPVRRAQRDRVEGEHQRALDEFHHAGELPAAGAAAQGRPADAVSATRPAATDRRRRRPRGGRAAHVTWPRAAANGYLAVQAYIAPTPERDGGPAPASRRCCATGRDRATTVGYGPRFLHSTGQLHKGGPPTGCFLQLVAGHPDDLPIPGAQGDVRHAHRRAGTGRLQVARSRTSLPVLRVHLSDDPDAGLAELARARAGARPSTAADRLARHATTRTEESDGAGDRRSRPHGRQHGPPAAPRRPSGGRLQPVARQDARDHGRGPRGRLHAGQTWSACSTRRASSG